VVVTDQRKSGGKTESDSGWVDTGTAAAALGVSTRTIRNMIYRGELDAKEEQEGITERYLVSVDSLYRLRDQRKSKAKAEDDFRQSSAKRQNGGNTTELLREAMARLETRAAENAELRTRLELTEQTDSTLREQLERERARADQLVEETRELREKLEEARQPWWRKLFGG
jgi:predicted RNase H-like nuclease (RuvC/YqgF family)